MAVEIANPANTLCILLSKSFTDSELPLKEKWYKLDFSSEVYSDSLKNALLNPEIVNNGKSLNLPPQNNLLPENFDIIEKDNSATGKP